MTIWFASGNINKKKELAAILNSHNLIIPSDAGLDFDPEETGATFYDNALLKARELYSLLEQRRPPLFTPGDPIIADDSGICVDALNGRPGIFSARYAGPSPEESLTQRRQGAKGNKKFTNYFKNFAPLRLCVRYFRDKSTRTVPPPSPLHKKLESSERNALLLGEIGDNPLRTARFVCAMALMFSPDRFFVAQETLEGEIVSGPQAARGTGGFGYDPILYIPGLGRTVAELSEDEKNTISHRAKAGRIIAAILEACR
jgi:XTP/dITP diphosphohydrolase